MLVSLTLRKHPHLIKLLATWTRDSRYHMLFPYARFNLHSFWMESNTEHMSPKTWFWAIRQMSGLVEALSKIHVYSTDPNTNKERTSRDGLLRLAVEDAEQKFGRHGDLKPQNILLLEYLDLDTSEDIGTLQIADFGLSRFHGKDSRSLVSPLGMVGSDTYMPPELILERPVSRAYDIWSLACVFLEFISWMLEGPEGFSDFVLKRSIQAPLDRITDDTFYTAFLDGGRQKTARVRQEVLEWIAKSRSLSSCSLMIDQLLTLIQDYMLVVDTAERIKIEALDVRMKELLYSARTRPSYLFKLVR